MLSCEGLLLFVFRSDFPPQNPIWNPICAHFSEGVRVYILEAKAHMSQSCEVIEGGLSLSLHYVDVQVSQREIVYRCGKNTNKVQDKELIFSGDAHRQNSLLDQSQVGLFFLTLSFLPRRA